MTFMDHAVAEQLVGEVLHAEFHISADCWAAMARDFAGLPIPTLLRWLGMTAQEYEAVCDNPLCLDAIVDNYRPKKKVKP